MKTFLLGAVAAIALVVAINGGIGSGSAHSQNGGLNQSVQQVDSYLDQNLSLETHDALAKRAHGASEWFKEIERRARAATQ